LTVNNILSDSDVQTLSEIDKDLMKQIEASLPNPALERMDRTEYMPGIDDPILKGTYSGKAIGSNPIFVRSGGYIPFNLLDARDRALNAAATAKADKLSKFDLRKPPVTKDPRFTENVQDMFYNKVNDYVSQAKKLYGDKWAPMLQDPKSMLGRKFAQELDNVDIIAKETDQITDIITKMDADILEGKGTYSAQTMDYYHKYKDLMGEFMNGNASESIRKQMNVLVGNMSVDEKLNKQILPQLERKVNEAYGKWGSQGTFDEIYKNRHETIREGAKEIAKQLKQEGGQYYNVDWVSEKMLEDRLISMMPDITEKDLKTQGRPSGYGSGYDLKPGEIFKTPYTEVSFTGDNGTTKVSASGMVQLNAGGKPVKVTGGKFFDPSTGQYFEPTGVVDFEPAALATFDVPGRDKNAYGGNVGGGAFGFDGKVFGSTPGLTTKTFGSSGYIVTTDKATGKPVKRQMILSAEGQTGAMKTWAPEAFDVATDRGAKMEEDYRMQQEIKPGEQLPGGGTVQYGGRNVTQQEYMSLKPGDKYWWNGEERTKNE
jgi:hypothetical protein